MRFNFRFEALLNYRAHIKERAEISLGRAQKLLREAREGLALLQDSYRTGLDDLSASMKRKTEAGQLINYSEYLTALKQRIANQHLEIQDRELAVKERMQEVVARTKEYRIIEKLKEKDFGKWKNEQNLQEQRILDESAVIRHGRTFL